MHPGEYMSGVDSKSLFPEKSKPIINNVLGRGRNNLNIAIQTVFKLLKLDIVWGQHTEFIEDYKYSLPMATNGYRSSIVFT